MKIESWFSTPVIYHDFVGSQLADIQQEIKITVEQVKLQPMGTPWGDKTSSTFKQEELVNDIKTYNMVNLERAIFQLSAEWCRQLRYVGAEFTLHDSWLNFAEQGGFQFDHKHPGNRISGCYYYQTTGNDGNIRFENPNTYALAGGFPYDSINADGVLYKPAVGRLILFPSWLTHRVSINKNPTERISLAFNLS